MSAAVSLSAVLVSCTQIYVAYLNNQAQLTATAYQENRKLEMQRTIYEKEQYIANLNNERMWKLEIARYLTQNRAEIYSDDHNKGEQIRNIMITTFPAVITKSIFTKLNVAVGNDTNVWEGGVKAIEKFQHELSYRILRVDDRIQLRVNGRLIHEGGTKDWSTIMLESGNNKVEINLYNRASYTGGLQLFGGRKMEGWSYSVEFKYKDKIWPFKGGQNIPHKDQFGSWFNVKNISFGVDQKSGHIKIKP